MILETSISELSKKYKLCIKSNNNSEIVKYVDKWKYNDGEYVLYLNDKVGTINMSIPLHELIGIAPNAKCIYFNGTKSYITKINDHYNFNCIHEKKIDMGYPHIIEDIAYISSNYLFNIFRDQSLGFEKPIFIPPFIPARVKSESYKIIPRKLFNTFQTNAVPKIIANAINTWIELNPEYDYYYYSDFDLRNYLKTNFSKSILRAYDSLIPGAFKADLWRYCVLYKEGGVYFDVKFGCVKKIDEFIDKDTHLAIINDRYDNWMFNGFIGSKPKQSSILSCIKKSSERILNKDIGPDPMYLTGPMLMRDALFSHYNWNTQLSKGKHLINKEIIQVYCADSDNVNVIMEYFTDVNGRIIKWRNSPELSKATTIIMGEKSLIKDITTLDHYHILWHTRRIFN